MSSARPSGRARRALKLPAESAPGLAVLIALALASGSAASQAPVPAPDTAVSVTPPAEETPPAPGPKVDHHSFGGLRLPAAPPAAEKPKSARQLAAEATAATAAPYADRAQSEKSRSAYRATWGIDKLRLRLTSSGSLIRFTYHVVEPKLAKPLGEGAADAYLYAPRAQLVLTVPAMEKVGPLRQKSVNETDRDYWVVFSNKGNLVHAGDHAEVVIGKFHATGLIIE